MSQKKIPTTIISGSLGAGKTTIIRNLVKQLPDDYKTIWLKNEYGDVNIDSELLKAKNIAAKEILNGCLCCVLVGKLHEALIEISDTIDVDRIIIETAGTAYPFPVITQVKRVAKLEFDGLVTVVDALNYEAFRDNSVMAKEQAEYVDLIILNKISLVNEKQLEKALDYVHDLYPGVPIIKTASGNIHKDAILGIDPKLVNYKENLDYDNHESHHEHADSVQAFGFTDSNNIYSQQAIDDLLEKISAWGFIRIKGIIKTDTGYKLLNTVFSRTTWQDLPDYNKETRIAFMSKNALAYQQKVAELFKQTILR